MKGLGWNSVNALRQACNIFSSQAPNHIYKKALPVVQRAYSTKRGYDNQHHESIQHPAAFWAKEAQHLTWFKRWDKVLDESHSPSTKWFVGAKTNICYNAVDRHIDQFKRGENTALIYESPVTSKSVTYTFNELREHVCKFSSMLLNLGVKKGDFVMIYLPMMPEAVFTMLGAARIGAPHVVVFGGFSAHELAVRIDSTKPKVIISASCGFEKVGKPITYKPMVDKAIEMASHKPQNVIVIQRKEMPAPMIDGRDLDFEELYAKQPNYVPCTEVESTDPLYVLHTSGSTGVPKGVLRDHGGYMTALRWSMEHVFGLHAGDRFWAASDVGWVVGHSYIVYGPLIQGCTSMIYEGKPVGTPDAGMFWKLVDKNKINIMFTAPTALRAIKKEDPEGELLNKYGHASLRALFLAGEHADPNSVAWIQKLLGKPVIDNWWQTETGWPMASNFMNLTNFPTKLGSVTKPVPGYDIRIMDRLSKKEVPRGMMGSIYVKTPLPPGCFATLWGKDGPDHEKYTKSYFSEVEGYYTTGDAGIMDDDGYLYVMSRTDDIINVAGKRLSTGAIEEVLSSHTEVAECAVVGVKDNMKGQIPIGFIVLKSHGIRTQQQLGDISKECVMLVRDKIGAVATFKTALVVPRLPKTRSGKILRGTIQKIADGVTYNTPATIEDPSTLTEIEATLKSIGYPNQNSQ